MNDPAGNPPGAELSDGNGGSGLFPDSTGSIAGADVDRAAAVAIEEVELAEVVVAAVVLRAVLVASEETTGTGGGPPAAGGGPCGGETLVMVVVEVVEDEDEVEEADDAAGEDEEMMGAGGATGLLGGPPVSFGCALLEEGTLLEPEVIVPDEPATMLVDTSIKVQEANLLAPNPAPGGPPAGGPGAPVGAGAGAGPATVTPVFTASEAGIDDNPGMKLGMLVVCTGASPMGQGHCPATGGGGPPPHQQPGGAIATDVHGAAAVTVI